MAEAIIIYTGEHAMKESVLTAGVVAAIAMTTFHVEAQSTYAWEICQDADLRATNSILPMEITFVNADNRVHFISWYDFNGQLQAMGTVNVGGRLTLSTYVGHHFRVTQLAFDEAERGCAYVTASMFQKEVVLGR